MSCPAVADWTEAVTAASTSALVIPGCDEAVTAASTILCISCPLVPSGTASATARDTESLTSLAISSADGPVGAASLTIFAISSADGPMGTGAAGSSLAQASSAIRTADIAISETIFVNLLRIPIVNPP